MDDKEKLILVEKITRRLMNCWEHHLDGSDIRSREHQSRLFSLIFNDLRWLKDSRSMDEQEIDEIERQREVDSTFLTKATKV